MPKKTNKTHESIIGHIDKRGFITIAEYMEIALKDYYSSKTVFGVKGDFTTSPEISQMFGEMIAAWFVDLWMQLGQPKDIKFIELGAGRGTLIADIMRTIDMIAPELEKEVTIHLVENSLSLRKIQKEKLKTYNVQWYNSFDEVPQGYCFLIANEFFDAMPIRQFEKINSEWHERVIDYNKNNFKFSTIKSDRSLIPKKFLDSKNGSIFEVSPVSSSIIKSISKRIKNNGGAALIIDYGHKESGIGDTLQAVSHHEYSDVLKDVGKKDITAHVDFESLKNIAKNYVEVFGPLTQREFLTSLGIKKRAEILCIKASKQQGDDISSSLNRLISATEMGDLFKVLALINKTALSKG